MLHRLLSGSSLACLPFSDCRGNRVDMSPLLSLPEAAKYLTDVGGRLVVLAGTNHVWRDAIPERFERMTASRASAGDPPRKAVSVAACLRPIGHFQRHPVPASRSDRPIGWSPIRRCHGVGSNCHL
ncbi:unnamed protein product [Durusdinium trenchii]|uniref:Haem-binding uptake Tiki superfamily ChaN domain-containing protein n=1 Tax=Durusdinium trenchii TaxID=1381693 RepID=A0ABP0S7G0_9DINO